MIFLLSAYKQANIRCPVLPPAGAIPNYKAPEVRLIVDS